MGMVQEVRIANRTGFCYGVREAIDKAKESAAAGKATHTLGQVVHNEGVIRDLVGLRRAQRGHPRRRRRGRGGRHPRPRRQARGLRARGEPRPRRHRRHLHLGHPGAAPAPGARRRGLHHRPPRHPQAPRGRRPARASRRTRSSSTRRRTGTGIPRRKRMALITQSTQPPWKFEKLAAFMVSRAHELKIVNTVCPVTIRRQEDTLETAREVDLMVVVGGRHSANTKELTRLCQIAGTPAVQIENARGPRRPRAVRGGPGRRRDRRHVDAGRGPARGRRRIFAIAGTEERPHAPPSSPRPRSRPRRPPPAAPRRCRATDPRGPGRCPHRWLTGGSCRS